MHEFRPIHGYEMPSTGQILLGGASPTGNTQMPSSRHTHEPYRANAETVSTQLRPPAPRYTAPPAHMTYSTYDAHANTSGLPLPDSVLAYPPPNAGFSNQMTTIPVPSTDTAAYGRQANQTRDCSCHASVAANPNAGYNHVAESDQRYETLRAEVKGLQQAYNDKCKASDAALKRLKEQIENFGDGAQLNALSGRVSVLEERLQASFTDSRINDCNERLNGLTGLVNMQGRTLGESDGEMRAAQKCLDEKVANMTRRITEMDLKNDSHHAWLKVDIDRRFSEQKDCSGKSFEQQSIRTLEVVKALETRISDFENALPCATTKETILRIDKELVVVKTQVCALKESVQKALDRVCDEQVLEQRVKELEHVRSGDRAADVSSKANQEAKIDAHEKRLSRLDTGDALSRQSCDKLHQDLSKAQTTITTLGDRFGQIDERVTSDLVALENSVSNETEAKLDRATKMVKEALGTLTSRLDRNDERHEQNCRQYSEQNVTLELLRADLKIIGAKRSEAGRLAIPAATHQKLEAKVTEQSQALNVLKEDVREIQAQQISRSARDSQSLVDLIRLVRPLVVQGPATDEQSREIRDLGLACIANCEFRPPSTPSSRGASHKHSGVADKAVSNAAPDLSVLAPEPRHAIAVNENGPSSALDCRCTDAEHGCLHEMEEGCNAINSHNSTPLASRDRTMRRIVGGNESDGEDDDDDDGDDDGEWQGDQQGDGDVEEKTPRRSSRNRILTKRPSDFCSWSDVTGSVKKKKKHRVD